MGETGGIWQRMRYGRVGDERGGEGMRGDGCD